MPYCRVEVGRAPSAYVPQMSAPTMGRFSREKVSSVRTEALRSDHAEQHHISSQQARHRVGAYQRPGIDTAGW